MSLDVLHLENDRRLATVLFSLVLIPAVWFAGVDLAGESMALSQTWLRLVPHVASGIVALVSLWFVRRARTAAAMSTALFGSSLAIVPVLLAIAVQQPQGWFLQPSQAVLPLVALYGALPNTFARQVGPPLLFTLGLMAGRLTWFRGAGGDVTSDLVVLGLVNAIGVLMVRRRTTLQRVVAELFRELQTLRGIIPICSHCKKVRTSADQWQQIERYVKEHSAAEFSHGICPDCLRTYYPELSEPVQSADGPQR